MIKDVYSTLINTKNC